MKLLALFIGLSAQTAIAASPADFAMVLPINTDRSSAAWQIELSTEVYQWSQDENLGDIAIFNAAGQAVPMMRWHVEPETRTEEHKAELPIFNLPTDTTARPDSDLQLIVDRDANGRVRRIETSESETAESNQKVSTWLLDSSDFKEGIDAITLSWSSPDSGVVARFDVDASDDLQTWIRIRSDATVALFEREGLRIERRQIELDGKQFRYLRLHRLDNGMALIDMRIVALRQRSSAEVVTQTQWLDAESQQTLHGVEHSNTRALYTLPASIPASLLRIELASDNALAQLDVSTPVAIADSKTNWIHRARLVAYRLRQAGTEIDNGEIRLSSVQRISELRIDSATPLSQSPRVRAGFTPGRVVFLAEGEGPYLLAVGSSLERRPNYPVEAAIASLRKQLGANWQPPLARLEAARESAGARVLREPVETLAWKRWLLWAVLIGAAALVGGMALTLLRTSSQSGEENRQ